MDGVWTLHNKHPKCKKCGDLILNFTHVDRLYCTVCSRFMSSERVRVYRSINPSKGKRVKRLSKEGYFKKG
jgi:ribosomal protein L37E